MALPPAGVFASGRGGEVECFRAGQADSSLAVRAQGKVVLNINDCDLPVATLRSMSRDLGRVDILLDQFSIAGWSGNAKDISRAKEAARRVMHKFVQDIEILKPRYVIPF